ncbi:hypothetical protein IR083_07830 [Dysgonomonas sp. GY75]|uniref:hypothetical protein n=1 Tax=Dysgonomonas sp. GY75 TaxID=2780419 RepID=UPI001883E455|nr:hypothetical protein [Dysgonomonas sp. GY75]MBF0648726.1 hypothetical protein [Dysgonomonas sp. GY75]
MRFIETLEKLRLYLGSKPALTPEEKELLGKIREDLNYFPTCVIHRDDLIEYAYDAHLIKDNEMVTLGKKIGIDSWEQLSSVRLPVIGYASNLPVACCPLCGEQPRFEHGYWYCENVDCQREWSCMKYVWLKYTDKTAFLFGCDIGFISKTNRTNEMSLYLPVDLFRMHFGKEPEKEDIFHIFKYGDMNDIYGLREDGFILEKVTDNKGLERFGPRAYWLSCYPKD